jgi:hypothetical protein
MEPVGTSPVPVAAMNAVIVDICSRGLKVIVASCPAAISTIIVSPIARDMARTYAATMPETAAGTTIRVETCRREAPSP